MSLSDVTELYKEKIPTRVKARQKATEGQWQMVEEAIKAFQQKYPHVWIAFCEDMQKEKGEHETISNKYANILDSSKKKKAKSERRKTSVFPSAQWYNREGELITDSLLWIIECIIPGLTHKDSVNYIPFLKKFPVFLPTYHISASEELK